MKNAIYGIGLELLAILIVASSADYEASQVEASKVAFVAASAAKVFYVLALIDLYKWYKAKNA